MSPDVNRIEDGESDAPSLQVSNLANLGFMYQNRVKDQLQQAPDLSVG